MPPGSVSPILAVFAGGEAEVTIYAPETGRTELRASTLRALVLLGSELVPRWYVCDDRGVPLRWRDRVAKRFETEAAAELAVEAFFQERETKAEGDEEK